MQQVLCHHDFCLVQPCQTHNKFTGYIPKKLILAVAYYENGDRWMEEELCNCVNEDQFLKANLSIRFLEFPLYKVSVKNTFGMRNLFDTNQNEFVEDTICHYILDSSEHEHMERYLAGTDNPMYDFVHELRYNPRALPTSAELVEVNEDFNDRKRLKKE